MEMMNRFVSPINPAVFPHLTVVLLGIGIFFMAWFFVYPFGLKTDIFFLHYYFLFLPYVSCSFLESYFNLMIIKLVVTFKDQISSDKYVIFCKSIFSNNHIAFDFFL